MQDVQKRAGLSVLFTAEQRDSKRHEITAYGLTLRHRPAQNTDSDH